MMHKLFQRGISLGTSKTARHLYWVFSGNAFSTVLTFFTLVLVIAPRITKAEYGIFLSLFTLANLLSDLGEAGLGSALTRFIPPLLVKGNHARAKSYLATAFKMDFWIAMVLGGLVMIFSPILSHELFAATPVSNVLLTGFMTIFMIGLTFSTFALSAHQKFPEVTVVNIFYSLVRLFMLVIAVFLFKLSLGLVLVIYALAAVFAWAYAFIFVGTDFLKVPYNQGEGRELRKFAFFLAIQRLFIATASRLDLLMLVPLAGAVEAGIYGMASRFSLVYPLVISSLGQVLSPKFAEFRQGREAASFFKKAAIVTLTLLLSLGVFYAFAAFFIRSYVTDYSEAIPVLQGLLIALAPFIMATPFVSLLTYTLKKPQLMSFASFLQLVVIFATNLYFLPKLGRFGPAVGIGLGNMTVLMITVAATWYYLKNEK